MTWSGKLKMAKFGNYSSSWSAVSLTYHDDAYIMDILVNSKIFHPERVFCYMINIGIHIKN